VRRLLNRNDADKLAIYLLGDETANTFMLGNLLYYGVENDRRTLRRGEYWGYYGGGALMGVTAYFNNAQCMLYYTDDTLLRQMAEDILSSRASLLLGSDQCVRPILPMLSGAQGSLYAHSQLFMERPGDAPAIACDGRYEFDDARGKRDNRAVQDFILRCMREGFGFNVSRGTVHRLLREKTQYEPYLLMKDGGKYVAQAHIQARTPGFCQIGGVCTLPEERRRGYAKTAVMKLTGMIAQDGGRVPCLVVNDDNSAARRMYEAMGFKETGRLILVDFL
jgi:ribosomal protein S18 acetylase RimI-like enzyme